MQPYIYIIIYQVPKNIVHFFFVVRLYLMYLNDIQMNKP